jgi:quinoprotein glucose dehydrogenase
LTNCNNTGSETYDTTLQPGKDWPVYGGNKEGNRYSPLDQINTENVKNLQIAWMYNAADTSNQNERQRSKAIQCQPIVVNGVLYGTTPDLDLFAIKAVQENNYGSLNL